MNYAVTLAETTDAADRRQILVVDDSEINREVLFSLLTKAGYHVILANNGKEAISRFVNDSPDLVLMDILMDGMSGYEAASKIQQLSGEKFTPILFVTSIDDKDGLEQCFKSGGVDYIHKPYSQVILKSKIKTFLHLAELYKTSQLQRDALDAHNKSLTANYQVAEGVFNKLMQSAVLDSPGFSYLLSPIAIFNGDILLAAYRPSGELHVMMGDFTGHGVSAAIGAIPVSDIFYGMTEKGFSINEIIAEINKKIVRIMPRGLFLAACFFEYSQDSRKLSVWNAGIPVAMIYNKSSSKVVYQFVSRNMPLGVTSLVNTSDSIDNYLLASEDGIVLCTDGIIEAKNPADEMYGLTRVIQSLEDRTSHDLIKTLLSGLDSFTAGETLNDDLTILGIEFDHVTQPVHAKQETAYPQPIAESAWDLQFRFEANLLKMVDPLPMIVQTIMEYQRLQRYKQDLFIIIKELFTNSFEHGLLQLDSKLKQSQDGFSQYYHLRQQRLAGLSAGQIQLTLKHQPTPTGGALTVIVSDTGCGFDLSRLQHQSVNPGNYHGRGIGMVRAICQSLEYSDQGRTVTATYHWSAV
jgi:two-component system, HptB-dependent secretion and biofilm response regulator